MSEPYSAQLRIESITEDLHDVASSVSDRGLNLARTYVSAAITSLRFARSALLIAEQGAPDRPSGDGAARLTFADGMPTPIFLVPTGAVHGRAIWNGSAFEERPNAECELPRLRAADLGADVITSPAARSFAAGPVGAALLADALGSRSWKHPSTPHIWSASRIAARTIVTALAGCSISPLADHLSGKVLDREVLLLIEGLGWRRHVGDFEIRQRPS